MLDVLKGYTSLSCSLGFVRGMIFRWKDNTMGPSSPLSLLASQLPITSGRLLWILNEVLTRDGFGGSDLRLDDVPEIRDKINPNYDSKSSVASGGRTQLFKLTRVCMIY